jgi:tetratricopeptide (TPR) repeat protein
MSDPRTEQYRQFLQLGHVATQHGQHDKAAAAYREATRLAPDRALPYVGLGGALARLGRTEDALAAYGAALDRAPNDVAALRSRSDALVAAGRRSEAAETLDRLAGVLEHGGRIAEACDATREALELAEARGRRREVERLVGRLAGAAADDSAAAAAIARARQVLDSVPTVVERTPEEIAAANAPPPPEPVTLTLAIEEALEAGDLDEARRRALTAAAAHRAIGHSNAAMDACYQALAIQPSDPDVHLLLAELYLDRGWRGPAADKLALLGRLTQLTDDEATRTRLCRLASERFPDDPRFEGLCPDGVAPLDEQPLTA